MLATQQTDTLTTQSSGLAIINQGIFGRLSTYVTECRYEIQQFNVETQMSACFTLASKFSDRSDLFAGDHRTMIELGSYQRSLTVDQWVTCNELPDGKLNFQIGYYIHTEDYIPHTIFFRISKSEENYMEKLTFFVSALLNRDYHLEFYAPLPEPEVKLNIDLIGDENSTFDSDDDGTEMDLRSYQRIEHTDTSGHNPGWSYQFATYGIKTVNFFLMAGACITCGYLAQQTSQNESSPQNQYNYINAITYPICPV